MTDFGFVMTLARKDLMQELRSKAATVATIFFAGIVLIIQAFAFSEREGLLAIIAPGALWVALAFAGVISAAQSYQSELEEGAFEQLLMYPIPRATIFLGKLLANWLYMSILGFVLLPISIVFFDMNLGASWLLMLLTILLGTLGFALIATFYAALTANLRARESLLPVLMFPVVVPILLAAVRATREIAGAGNLGISLSWLQLLLAFDLVYVVVCTAIFHFVTED
ncbi:MAG: heme exporter protein CcmB [Trueperaceae bacterium]|nr:heme exporter protein CcmB [Trueperaceae bacterium]